MAGSAVRAVSSTTTPSTHSSPASRASSSLGTIADADHHVVAGYQPAVGQPDAGDVPVLALERLDLRVQLEVDAVGPVVGGEEVGERLARRARQDARQRLDHHGVGPERAGRGRGLQADVAAADHRQPLAGAKRQLQHLGVGGAAQHLHALQVRARQAQPPRAGAGGEDQRVVGDRLAVLQRHGLGRTLDRGRPGREAQLDGLLGVEALRAQRQRCRRRPRPSARPWRAAGAGRARSAPRR